MFRKHNQKINFSPEPSPTNRLAYESNWFYADPIEEDKSFLFHQPKKNNFRLQFCNRQMKFQVNEDDNESPFETIEGEKDGLNTDQSQTWSSS